MFFLSRCMQYVCYKMHPGVASLVLVLLVLWGSLIAARYPAPVVPPSAIGNAIETFKKKFKKSASHLLGGEEEEEGGGGQNILRIYSMCQWIGGSMDLETRPIVNIGDIVTQRVAYVPDGSVIASIRPTPGYNVYLYTDESMTTAPHTQYNGNFGLQCNTAPRTTKLVRLVSQMYR